MSVAGQGAAAGSDLYVHHSNTHIVRDFWMSDVSSAIGS